MPDTFPYDTMATSGKIKLRVLSAQFGDGYKQSVGDGLNAKFQNWPVVFSGTKAYVEEIAAWLDDHQGFESFLWTPPVGVEGRYECSEYDIAGTDTDTFTITATFVQVFRP
jgi:phage-related protein